MAIERELKMRRALLLLLVVLFGSGCSKRPSVLLVNGSGRPVEVLHLKDGGLLDGFTTHIERWTPLADGAARKFTFGYLVIGGRLDGVVRLRADGCEYVYEVPDLPWRPPPTYMTPEPVQLGPDMRAYIKRPGRQLDPVAGLEPEQPPGFPVTPKKTCPAG